MIRHVATLTLIAFLSTGCEPMILAALLADGSDFDDGSDFSGDPGDGVVQGGRIAGDLPTIGTFDEPSFKTMSRSSRYGDEHTFDFALNGDNGSGWGMLGGTIFTNKALEAGDTFTVLPTDDQRDEEGTGNYIYGCSGTDLYNASFDEGAGNATVVITEDEDSGELTAVITADFGYQGTATGSVPVRPSPSND